jgi:hypothetical protein
VDWVWLHVLREDPQSLLPHKESPLTASSRAAPAALAASQREPLPATLLTPSWPEDPAALP